MTSLHQIAALRSHLNIRIVCAVKSLIRIIEAAAEADACARLRCNWSLSPTRCRLRERASAATGPCRRLAVGCRPQIMRMNEGASQISASPSPPPPLRLSAALTAPDSSRAARCPRETRQSPIRMSPTLHLVVRASASASCASCLGIFVTHNTPVQCSCVRAFPK